MKRLSFFLACATLICAQSAAQITIFNQRGKATQEMTDSGLCIAHPSLPNNSVVKVTNTITGKEVEATVVSRIPASRDRIADLSRGVWQALELNSDTDIILSITPPPRQRVPEPVPEVARSQPPAAKPTPAPSPQEPKPAANDDYLSMLRDMVIMIKNELQQPASPSTSVITVYPPYPPYPPQSVISNQPTITNFGAPADQPAVTRPAPSYAAPPAPVPQPTPAPAPRAAPQPDKDCYANPAPQPTKLQIIPRLPNQNSNEIYRLQVGSFCDPASANALEKRLKAAGYNVAREFFNKMHRVIITGIPAAQVQNTAQKLDAMGIKQIWVRK